FGTAVNGAIGSASGMAVALDVAQQLAAVRLSHLETWFVFTGGYEAGHTGMHQFLHENRLDPERTSFIVIDAVGAGYLRYTRAEGLIVPRNAASNLIRIARETARDNPVWNLRPVSLRSVPTDLYSISAKGYQGISLFAAAGDGYPPHWHRPEDTAENVHQETLEIASQAVLTMIRRLDEQANPEPEAPSAPN
ncbi:MAG TPA: M28 family peptidase, partial [Thermomicrobiaceae bacterium]|nr:M28 family peptidase [Thermomicrobiaceae bacterium]